MEMKVMKAPGMKKRICGFLMALVCLLSVIAAPNETYAAVTQPADLKEHYAYAVIDARTG